MNEIPELHRKLICLLCFQPGRDAHQIQPSYHIEGNGIVVLSPETSPFLQYHNEYSPEIGIAGWQYHPCITTDLSSLYAVFWLVDFVWITTKLASGWIVQSKKISITPSRNQNSPLLQAWFPENEKTKDNSEVCVTRQATHSCYKHAYWIVYASHIRLFQG